MAKIFVSLWALLFILPLYAATQIDLSTINSSMLLNSSFSQLGTTLKEISRSTDFNNTLHIRIKETFQGQDIIGADAVVHVPHNGYSTKSLREILALQNVSMNGFIYQDLYLDLMDAPAYIFNAKQKEKAISAAIAYFQNQGGKNKVYKDLKANLMVFLDEENKAHWIFYVSFFVPGTSLSQPEKPAYFLDAINFTIYSYWNDLHTLDKVAGGGFGGNHKTGKKNFDGLNGHQSQLEMMRDASKDMCYMKNDEVIVQDYRIKNPDDVVRFKCSTKNSKHNNIYWNSNHDTVEGAWSPSNDAMYGTMIAFAMFKDWYNIPILIDEDKNNKPMRLPVTVHDPVENAYWHFDEVVFGDSEGSNTYNPFTSLDTVVHEIGHGFTQQHAHLYYSGQSGGLNEAFSDMAGIAAEYYAYGKTEFLIGYGDIKEKNKALRYMEKPSKDCGKRKPGENCSIDKLSQYHKGLDVHYSSGIFDHVYYLLALSKDWDAKKAFDVMVKANMHYWTSESNFQQAACGVMKATKDYHYDLTAPAKAFLSVGIDIKKC